MLNKRSKIRSDMARRLIRNTKTGALYGVVDVELGGETAWIILATQGAKKRKRIRITPALVRTWALEPVELEEPPDLLALQGTVWSPATDLHYRVLAVSAGGRSMWLRPVHGTDNREPFHCSRELAGLWGLVPAELRPSEPEELASIREKILGQERQYKQAATDRRKEEDAKKEARITELADVDRELVDLREELDSLGTMAPEDLQARWDKLSKRRRELRAYLNWM